MDVFQAIRERRSIGRVKPDPISRERIEQLLEAANWAPSHHATEPWRFYVMTGAGRQRLGEAYADIAMQSVGGGAGAAVVSGAAEPTEAKQAERAKHIAKAYRAPVVIAVSVSPSAKPGVNRIEEFAAAHCAVHNMLLAAHALGLGAIWRSGEPMYHPRMKEAFGLADTEELVALVYVGEPAVPQPECTRRPVQQKTVWLEE
ncbi:nitroreductase [Paenibacillus sp. YYML68]|uniref:nitroreductase family protein n=1 Tax=Paenibacillus sp. YYML68 TaxID=2909250 RepID=UPI00248F7559|nr:nitroreductase [Paenibacillus sp. YYML68]